MRVFFNCHASSERIWETFLSGFHSKKGMHILAKEEWAISPYGACTEITILLQFARLCFGIFAVIMDR
jgi:hypothetical protein